MKANELTLVLGKTAYGFNVKGCRLTTSQIRRLQKIWDGKGMSGNYAFMTDNSELNYRVDIETGWVLCVGNLVGANR